MRSINLLLTVLLLLFFTSLSFAQRRGMPTVEEKLTELKKELKLDDKQSEKIKSILEDNHKKMQELRDKKFDDRRDMFEAMRELQDKEREQIKKELTDTQKDLYDKSIEKREKERQERRSRRDRPRNW